MEVPGNLLYSEEHEWVRYDEPTGIAVVGITDFAQGELGDIVYVDLEPVGTNLESGSVFGTVEAVKTVSELFAPTGGEVTELNAALEASPEMINTDPYGDGWMIKIKVDDAGLPDTLLTAEQYSAMLGEAE